MQKIIPLISYLCLVVGAVLPIFDNMRFAPYVFSVGAFILITLAVIEVWKNRMQDFKKTRLFRINLLATLTLAIAAYLMFVGSNSWVVFLLLYTLLTIFLSYRIK